MEGRTGVVMLYSYEAHSVKGGRVHPGALRQQEGEVSAAVAIEDVNCASAFRTMSPAMMRNAVQCAVECESTSTNLKIKQYPCLSAIRGCSHTLVIVLAIAWCFESKKLLEAF